MAKVGHDRREFVGRAFCLTLGAGVAASGLGAQAQTPPRPIRRSERYDDSFITERKPFKWPGENTLAVWFAPNVEVWQYDSAFGVGISPNPTNYVPDVFNYAWREYGPRVGLWRLADVLDEAGVKATVALNSQVCGVYPKAVEEMKKRGWEFMGHGTTNPTTLAGLNLEQERDTIRGVLRTIGTSHRSPPNARRCATCRPSATPTACAAASCRSMASSSGKRSRARRRS